MANSTCSQNSTKMISNASLESKVRRAIPNISTAIASIIAKSKNKQFRQRCLDMLQITRMDALSKELDKRLWDLSSRNFGIQRKEADQQLQVVPTSPKTVVSTAKAPSIKQPSPLKSNFFDDLSDSCFTPDELNELCLYEDPLLRIPSEEKATCKLEGSGEIREPVITSVQTDHSQLLESELAFFDDLSWGSPEDDIESMCSYKDCNRSSSMPHSELTGASEKYDEDLFTVPVTAATSKRETSEVKVNSKIGIAEDKSQSSDMETNKATHSFHKEHKSDSQEEVSDDWLDGFENDPYWMAIDAKKNSSEKSDDEQSFHSPLRKKTTTPSHIIKSNNDENFAEELLDKHIGLKMDHVFLKSSH